MDTRLQTALLSLQQVLLQIDADVHAEIILRVNDDVPDGYTLKAPPLEKMVGYAVAEKIVETQGGLPTKVISLYIPD